MKKNNAPRLSINFLPYNEVQELTGLSRTTIYREIKLGRFPRPRIISARKVGFLKDEFEAWAIQRQMA